MPVNQNDYSPSNLKGNADVAKNTLATLHGSVRRNDPDGVSNTPYFPNASGKNLKITYTKEVATVVTDTVVNVALTSADYATIISTINAVDPSNLMAIDLGGFLGLRNLNPGKTHRIEVNAYATPASDAAPILGFVVTPYPGSISYVDEVASTPGVKGQNNPQGTALIGRGEDLDSDSINRALSSVLDLINNNSIDLDTPVIVFRDIALTFALQVASGLNYASIADDTIRLPIKATELGGITASDKYFKVFVDSGGAHLQSSVQTSSQTASGYTAHKYIEDTIDAAVYGTSLITIDPSVSFSAWGTPDGHSIYGASVPNKDKQASTAITSITGDIIYCAGAAFQTNKVGSGDPVFLTASVLTPFDHTGWFIVKKVYDETHISVRPVGPAELVPDVGNKPRSLNPVANGTLRVAMGYYIPAGSVLLVASRAGTFVVRMAVAVPLREALAYELANVASSRQEAVLSLLNAHLITTSAAVDAAHPVAAIKGFDSTNNWADGTVMHYASSDLKAFLQDMIGLLADETLGAGGTRKIGGASISIGGATPNSLSAGTLYAQLTALLTLIQTASTAAGTSYAGGPAWADGTTNPATTVEAELDKVITDLGGGTGGTAKISGAAVGSDLAAERLDQQITDLVNNWGKLTRANAWSALQTFANNVSIGSGLLSTLADALQARVTWQYNPSLDMTLLWESSPSTGSHASIRAYVSTSGLLFFTQNAKYDSSDALWHKDVVGTIATMWDMKRGHFETFGMVDDTPWAIWTQITDINVAQPTTSINNAYSSLVAVFDSDGNRRVISDHLGFPNLRTSVMREDWLTLPTLGPIADGTVYNQWTVHSSGSGSFGGKVQVGNGQAEGYMGLDLSTGNAVGQVYIDTDSIWCCDNIPAWPHQDMCVVAEWEVQSSISGNNVRIGFTAHNSSTVGAWFQQLSSGNWKLFVGNGSGNDLVDTGIAPTNQTQRMRIECYGSNMPGGARVLGFINGALVAEASTHMPDNNQGFIVASIRSSSTASWMNVGPIYVAWNRTANGNRSNDNI